MVLFQLCGKKLKGISKFKGCRRRDGKRHFFLISPEGTRTLTGEIGPFKKGPFHLAKNTNATIVPVALKGGFRAKKKNDWRLYPGVLTVVFGEMIKSIHYEKLNIRGIKRFDFKKIIELKKGDNVMWKLVLFIFLYPSISTCQTVEQKYGDRIELLGIPFKDPLVLCQIFIALFFNCCFSPIWLR